MNEKVILQVLAEQQEYAKQHTKNKWISRKEEEFFEFESNMAQVVIGVRRSGKSTLCHKVLLQQNIRYAYVDFDDDRLLGLQSSDLNTVLNCVYQLYGTDIQYIFLDEVHGDIVCLGQAAHGQYCLGCGKVHNYEEHSVPEWIPNDDGGLFLQQTQTGKCEICKGEITESIPGSEKFVSIFDTENMTDTELEIVGYLYSILVSLIQMLVGIK